MGRRWRGIVGRFGGRIAQLKERGVAPGLAFVRVGENAASKVYVGRKEKACHELGIASETHVLPETATQDELLKLLDTLNASAKLHGILVQAPLPRQIDSPRSTRCLPCKDVDGFHPLNVGKLMLGDSSGFHPCTPAGIRELLNVPGLKLPALRWWCSGAAISSANPWRPCSAKRTRAPTRR